MSESPHAPWSLRAGHPRVVLFLHGIMGSPAQFRALGQVLHAAGWDCSAALLAGHGGAQGDFSGSRRSHWLQSAQSAIAEAAGEHRTVVVFGHSMGCLLALECAARGAPIAGLALLSPALYAKVSLTQGRRSLRTLFGRAARDDQAQAVYRSTFSIARGPVLGYVRWIAPMLSLARLSRAARKALGEIRCPVLVIQSRRDESVRRAGVHKIARALTEARVVWLADSGHIHFTADDAKKIGEETLAFLAQFDAVNPSSLD